MALSRPQSLLRGANPARPVTTSELSADYPPLRGLLFDFDGTLVDSELELHLPAFNQA
ncbi:MAG TPA: hypothetical protein EYP93_04635, partial [Gammaproteobacteria bacterium]|nr:hypothetical protein [Gammaproteobacteria bacterium]